MVMIAIFFSILAVMQVIFTVLFLTGKIGWPLIEVVSPFTAILVAIGPIELGRWIIRVSRM